MRTSLRLVLPALVVCLAGSLHADTTGRLSGKVTSADGKPVVDAAVLLSRIGIAWKKELKTDAKGTFFQVGLDPKEFELTITAKGFVDHKETIKIPLGETLNKSIVLKTVAEAMVAGTGAPPAEAVSIKAEMDATTFYNSAVGFYSAKDYAQALAPCEAAYKGFKEAVEQTKDEAAKNDLVEKGVLANRLLGMVYYNLGKNQDAKEYLVRHLEKNPKDGVVVVTMLKIAQAAKDKAAEAKYQALLEAIEGPRPETAYNEGVTALNAGQFQAAKDAALKSLQVKADYADAYYLLGIAEFGLNHLKAAKENLKKYLEMAPTGSKAAEVKEMLKSF